MNESLTVEDLGLVEETTSVVSAEHTSRIGAVLDEPHTFTAGEPLPLLWHWAHFTPLTPTAQLGSDGHPVLPPGPTQGYPRRMWASGLVEAPGHLVVGQPATRTTRVMRTKASEGRSGALLIVTVEHRYAQDGTDRIVEEQTLVYRTPGPPVLLPAGDHHPVVTDGQWAESHRPDAVTLFRFSAVTFNSHRIHYDQPYATAVEGYPALVVHGPLTALRVGESIRRQCGQELARFEFRATAPLFADLAFTIVGTPADDGPTAVVVRNDGTEAMTAHATLGGPLLPR